MKRETAAELAAEEPWAVLKDPVSGELSKAS